MKPVPTPSAPNGATHRRRVLVTGASSGIGAASVRALVGAGFDVVAGVRSKRDAARLTAERVTPVLLDVTRKASVYRAAAQLKKTGGLFGLVNNAGVTLTAPVEHTPLPDWRALFEVNVFGVVAVTQAVLPMLRAARGRIVTVGSLSSVVAAPFLGAYCASKAAIEGLTDALRLELAAFGVEVSLVLPGPTQSNIWAANARATKRLRRDARSPEYAQAWDTFDAVLAKAASRAGPVEPVAAAVVDALTAQTPKTRYALDGGRAAELRAMDDRARDAQLLAGFGLTAAREEHE